MSLIATGLSVNNGRRRPTDATQIGKLLLDWPYGRLPESPQQFLVFAGQLQSSGNVAARRQHELEVHATTMSALRAALSRWLAVLFA